ncbi:unnamed protein product [Thelazia callipaeda]|uniref:Bystin n=1 Tax=Thelazia callipaeda TaxID=103827 RepID=A0A0N5DA35_THECL|nr:unnamed protein product [Thelazia callipaeda]
MGKSKKLKSYRGDFVTRSALPLDEQIERSKRENKREKSHIKQRILKRSKADDEYIDGSLSSKILKLAWKQKRDEEAVEEEAENQTSMSSLTRNRTVSLGDVSVDSLSDDEFIDCNQYEDDIVNLNPEDEAAIEKFLVKPDEPSQTLYDIISKKIEQKKLQLEFQLVDQQDDDFVIKNMDSKVVEMYREIGVVLSHYRSGKIPKAFKVLPNMMNWEQLFLTNPDKWSAAAMYQATRIFASNLHARMCQRFYNLILLPRLRDDIIEYKKLNFHLFQALHKAVYKPQAFFKGILLPLCESGTCTLREATIFGSVLSRASIPMLHAAAAMLRIANMQYTGSNSLFLRILIDKKYTLPYRAIDALVNHFLRFRNEERQLPVLWHQSLLAFAQRYKNDINDEQRAALLELTKANITILELYKIKTFWVQNHYQISPEVCRELMSYRRNEHDTEANH